MVASFLVLDMNIQPLGVPGALAQQNTKDPERVKYVLYACKSTESEERQVLSIDSQIAEMLKTAENDGLEIVDIRRESHSAKDSGQRPVFNEILKDIRIGRYTGILTWAPDRLSRNAGDLGSLVDLMDQKLLAEIRTNGQRFINSPNEKFLLMNLCSQAKLEFEINFKTIGNKNLSRANIYRILQNTFYYGLFEYPVSSRNFYNGRHEPLITKELFDKVQKHLKRDSISRETREFAFTKLLKCACGSGISACEKYKK